MTADILLFKPNVRGNGGRGPIFWPESVVDEKKLSPFVGKVGFKNHANSAKGEREDERSVDDMAWVVEKVYVENKKPMATVKFLDKPFYEKVKTAKEHMGVSILGDVISTKYGMCPDGKFGKMVLGFSDNIRPDAVSSAGAGGKVVRVRESSSVGGDFMDITLEALEADEKGKEILAHVRESAVAETRGAISALEAKVNEMSEALKAKDVELVKVRESASPNKDTQLLEKLATENAEFKSKFAAMELKDAINTKVRESKVPSDMINDAIDILSALPRDKWDNYLAHVKKEEVSTTNVQGNVEHVREGSAPKVPENWLDAAVKGLIGITPEEYHKIPAGAKMAIV